MSRPSSPAIPPPLTQHHHGGAEKSGCPPPSLWRPAQSEGPQETPLQDRESANEPFQPPQVPRGIAVLLLAAALAQNFSSGCVSLFLYKDLAYQPVEATRYWMYVGLTMWFQPVVGWLSDRFVVCGERRRPLFLVSVCCSAVVFFFYQLRADLLQNHSLFLALSLVNQLFIMGAYIPLNGLLVEIGKKEREQADESGARMGAVMSQAMTIRSIGSLGGSLLQTVLLFFLSVRTLLGVTAVLHVVVAGVMAYADRDMFTRPVETPLSSDGRRGSEPGHSEICGGARKTCKKVSESFDIRDVHSDGFSFVLVLLFVFFYNAMPDAGTVYYAYLFSEFDFPPWFYSMNGLIGALGSTAGAYLFSLWLEGRSRRLALQHAHGIDESRREWVDGLDAEGGTRPRLYQDPCGRMMSSVYAVFVVGSAVWALAYLTNLMLCTGFVTEVLHIPAGVFVPIDNFFVSVCVRFAFMPTIIMAAEHAPHNFEATAFEVFSVASMAGSTFSSLTTSLIAQDLGITRENSRNLYQMLLISIACKLAPIPVAYFLPERRHHDGHHVISEASGAAGEGGEAAAQVPLHERSPRTGTDTAGEDGGTSGKPGRDASPKRRDSRRSPHPLVDDSLGVEVHLTEVAAERQQQEREEGGLSGMALDKRATCM